MLLALAATVVSLGVGLLMKSPCLYRAWGPPDYVQYRTLCYSDLQPLYGLRGLDERRLPYVEEKSYEYPALIALEMWLASHFADSHVSYFLANVPFLGGAALVSTWALVRAMGPRRRRVLLFALAPPLVFYSFHNWDLLAVAPLALCVWAWSRGDAFWAGGFSGLGAAAKLFPGYGVPFLASSLLRPSSRGVAEAGSGDGRTGYGGLNPPIRLVLAAVGAWLGVNLPFVALELLRDGSLQGWLGVFAFHARRLPDFGTVWYWWPEWVREVGPYSTAAVLVPVVVWAAGVGSLAVFAWWLYRQGSCTRVVPFGTCLAGLVGMVAIAVLGVGPRVSGGPTTHEYKGFVDSVSLGLFAVGFGLIILRHWRLRRDPWASFAAVVCLFLLASKVHSPQYALWLVVFFVVVQTPWPLIAAYFVADAILLASGFWWFADSPELGPNGWRTVFVVSVYIRALALGALLVWYSTAAKDLVDFGGTGRGVDLDATVTAGSHEGFSGMGARHWTEVKR